MMHLLYVIHCFWAKVSTFLNKNPSTFGSVWKERNGKDEKIIKKEMRGEIKEKLGGMLHLFFEISSSLLQEPNKKTDFYFCVKFSLPSHKFQTEPEI